MKDTEIVEILPDGTVYHFDMDVCNAEAEQALEMLWEKEDNQIGFDYTATVYSLFVRAVTILSQSGWSTDDLIDSVVTHSDGEYDDDIDADDELD